MNRKDINKRFDEIIEAIKEPEIREKLVELKLEVNKTLGDLIKILYETLDKAFADLLERFVNEK
jgi:hypothetical protein